MWAIEYFDLEGSTTKSRGFRDHLRRRLADPYLMLENWRGGKMSTKCPIWLRIRGGKGEF